MQASRQADGHTGIWAHREAGKPLDRQASRTRVWLSADGVDCPIHQDFIVAPVPFDRQGMMSPGASKKGIAGSM